MSKKIFILTAVLALVTGFSAIVSAEDAAAPAKASGSEPTVRIGADIKLFLFDQVNGYGRSGATQFDLKKNYGTTFTELDLSINAKLNDLVSFMIQPKWGATTGATPKLGQTVTNTAKPMAASDMGHGVAEMILNLPQDITIEVGQLRPHFSMDYGESLFFEEEMLTDKAVHDVMILEDYGILASKSFSFGELTLPVHVALINGPDGDFAFENNNQPGLFLHVEPTYGPVELYGSLSLSKWDPAERYGKEKYLAGISFKWEGLTIRSEYATLKTENFLSALAVPVYGVDYLAAGYYIKVFYRVLPWLQFMFDNNSVIETVSTITTYAQKGLAARYDTNILGALINLSDSTILMINVDVGNWVQNDRTKSTVYTRPYIAVRSTF